MTRARDMAELEIERDDRFVANERRTHRVAVVVMTLVVLGGALGVFGFGPLASATRRGDGFTVRRPHLDPVVSVAREAPMDAIARALAAYLFLLVLFRVSGKRTLAEASNFDFVLLLIVAEATQQALLGDDFSVTNSILIITTLFLTDVAATWLKNRSERFDRLIDGLPVLLMDRGAVLHGTLDEHRINVNDILEEARRDHGLRSLAEIDYAVLERSGDIAIIPRADHRA